MPATTLGRRTEIDYTHMRQTDGTGQFARVKLNCEPLPQGSGFVFENKIGCCSIPKEFIRGVEKGIKWVMNAGPLVGFAWRSNWLLLGELPPQRSTVPDWPDCIDSAGLPHS